MFWDTLYLSAPDSSVSLNPQDPEKQAVETALQRRKRLRRPARALELPSATRHEGHISLHLDDLGAHTVRLRILWVPWSSHKTCF